MSGKSAAGLLWHAARASWELRRAARGFTRRFGIIGWAVLGCALCAALAFAAERRQSARIATLEMRLAAQLARNAAASAVLVGATGTHAADDGGARARLKAFDEQLLPHEAIPFVVQDLLDLGASEGLSMQRGTYRPQVDVAGRFMRYRMTLPVKGPAPAIQRFMKLALFRQANLALDSVQFKRARIGASDIEARIHWVMLTRLPSQITVAAPANGAAGAVR